MERMHTTMAPRFCVALMLLLSCRALSAQPTEDPQTLYNRGADYWYGRGVAQDYLEAANWFRKSAEQDMPKLSTTWDRCWPSVRALAETTPRPRPGIARRPNRVSFGRNNLGTIYVSGQGVERDYVEGCQMVPQSSRAGICWIATQPGCIVPRQGCSGSPRGAGLVPQNSRSGIRRGGVHPRLDVLRRSGCFPRPAEALTWFRKSGEQEYAPAEFNMGVMY